MTVERLLNPEIRNYAQGDGGELVRGDALGNEAIKRLLQPAGAAILEPQVGRPQRERLKDLPENRRLLLDDFAKALKPIIDGGRAKSISVIEDPDTAHERERMFLKIDCVKPDGSPATYKIWAPISG